MGRGFLSRLWRDRSGAAAAEMVLLLPLATFMLLLTIEAGYFMYVEHEVVKSVRDAARWGARQPFSAYNCTAIKAEADLPSDDSALGKIRSTMVTIARRGAVTETDTPLVINKWAAGDVNVRYDCIASTTGLYKATGFAPRVTVIATPSYPSLFNSLAVYSNSNKLYARQQALVVGI